MADEVKIILKAKPFHCGWNTVEATMVGPHSIEDASRSIISALKSWWQVTQIDDNRHEWIDYGPGFRTLSIKAEDDFTLDSFAECVRQVFRLQVETLEHPFFFQ
jgi:hypothetical protein